MKLFGFEFFKRRRTGFVDAEFATPVVPATKYLEPSPGLTTAETMAELKKLKGAGIQVLSHRKTAVKKYAAKKKPMPMKKGKKK